MYLDIALLCFAVLQNGRKNHIVKRRKILQQRLALCDETDGAIAHDRHLPVIQSRHVVTVQIDGSGRGFEQTGYKIQQRAFTIAGTSNDRHELALIQGEIDMIHSRERFATTCELASELFYFENICWFADTATAAAVR